MSGRFTGLNYDREAYDEKLSRSTYSGMYKLDSNFAVNCNKCFAPYGPRGTHDSADVVGQQIDVDSILRGVSKISTKSNSQQVPDSLDGYSVFVNNDCSEYLEPEYTRYTYPAYDIKGLNVPDLRMEYPHFDPQCQIFENFEVNTRLEAKDNHKAIWQIPMSQKDLFPTERLGKVKNCSVQLNCNYAPVNQ